MTMQHGITPLPSCRFLQYLVCTWLLLSLATMHVSTPPAAAADSEGMRTLLAQAQPTAPSPTPPPSLLILPINRAKFLAGARFDFRVEANHLPAKPTAWEVTIAGQTPEAFFGVQGQVTNTSDHSQEQTFRDVTLAEPGIYMVSAKVVAGEITLAASVAYEVVLAKPLARQAKNVLLFIGDGMSLPFRTAARLVSRGMQEGKYRSMLEMDDMDHYAVVTTSGMDAIATDSANSASAYATGHKSVVNAMGIYPDNTIDPNDDPRVETVVELVKRTRNMAVGLVTTTEIQDATPAAMFAHTRRRSEYLAIMDQYLHPAQSADVIMGGGSASLLPQSTAGSRRKDNRDLFKEFETKGYHVATTRTELRATSTPDKLLGLFHLGNMNVYLDKAVFKKADVLKQFTDQPMLWEMTQKALDILGKNTTGFFLMVEGGLIDKQAHPVDWQRAIWDTIELDKAVGVAKKWAMAHGDNTLIIVVADHAHSMSITGTYWEGDGKKGREAVRVYSEAQFPDYRDTNGDGFPDNVDVSRSLAIHWANHPDYYESYKVFDEHIEPTVKEGEKWSANNEVHTVEDVPLTASGPGAEQFHKTLDNTEVFFAIVNALGLDARQGKSPFVAER